MTQDTHLHRKGSLAITLAAIVIILSGVKYAENIISPMLIALFITAISAPAMLWLTQRKVPSGIAVTLIIFTIVTFGVIVTSVLSTSIHRFSDNLPEYQERLQLITQSMVFSLNKIGLNINIDEMVQTANLGKVMGFVGSTFNQFLGALTNIFLILMMVIFLLLELGSFNNKFRIISNDPGQTMANLSDVTGTINKYFKIKTITSIITAIPIIMVLSLMGIDFPLLWGLVVFLLNFVPNIGSILAAAKVIILYLLVNNIVANFLEPKLMGRNLGLSTLVVFLSLVFWGWLLGPVGMFLSVPLTMTLKIIMDNNDNTRWIAILLSNDAEIEQA